MSSWIGWLKMVEFFSCCLLELILRECALQSWLIVSLWVALVNCVCVFSIYDGSRKDCSFFFFHCFLFVLLFSIIFRVSLS